MNEYYHETVMQQNQIPGLVAVLDGKDIKDNFPLDIFIPAHWHRSIEISLIEDAEVVLHLGNQEIVIENDFTCVNSSVPHSLKGRKLGENPKAIILLISYDFIKQFYPNIDNITFDLNIKKDHFDLKQLYKKLEHLYLQQDEYTYLEINACILEIFTLLLRNYQGNKQVNKQTNHQEQIKAILAYLHEHYNEDLSLLDMAEQFHLSNEYFSRKFHYYIGKTFRDYLASYRLYKAYDDVINSNKDIKDIAMIHGFLNVKSFIKIFKDTYSLTPLQYRKKMSRN